MKEEFANAGLKGEPITNKSGVETGTKYQIPNATAIANGNKGATLTVRAMDGQVHGKRTSFQNSGNYVRADGSPFKNNPSKGSGHYPQD